ncbi:hypothetical protein Q5P01_022637 [Channa striata]|uniref:Coiled-coil domain-containing protein 24 n=1 Tax=Channa striata TaxID=64152 RepID=A0AA88JD28_CHASR|nr:hypothetical protein Q5P01_022637 [Channa striata]
MNSLESPDGNQIWCPGPSLWNLITEHVYRPELPKIRSALGHYLVDMYTEVHTEAEMWYSMWQESQRGRQPGLCLSDPPAVKELVRAEVKMLLQTLRERASKEGRDCQELLVRYNPDTVNYALSHLESCYADSTNHGDTDSGSRPSSQCSVQSNAEDEIKAVKDKLNVTDVDQVVNRLRSVLMEECEVLKKLIHHLRENIKQNYGCKRVLNKSEPSLAELRELRGAVQMDLELYPSSSAALSTVSSPLPVKQLRNKFRPSVGLKASDETLRALTAASALRPRPPPSPCHTNPRPPPGPPRTKTSTSVKQIHTVSPSTTHDKHRSTSAITKSSNKITTSEHMNSHFTTEQILVNNVNNCRLSPDQGTAGPHHRSVNPGPISQIITRTTIVHEAHLSSHHSAKNGSKCDLSPRNVNVTPSHVPAHCDSGSRSSSDHTVSTTKKSKTQNGQQKSTCESSSTSVQTDNDKNKNTSESFYHSDISETGATPSKNSRRKSSSGIGGDINVNFRKDVNQQSSLHNQPLAHQSDFRDELSPNKSGHPASIQINRHIFTSPARPLRGATSQQKSVYMA